jgi:hypothetical protein
VILMVIVSSTNRFDSKVEMEKARTKALEEIR